MISVDELLYTTFKIKTGGIDNAKNEDIPLPDKIMILNLAQFEFITSRYDVNNLYRMGFEAFRKRIDELQVLKVNDYPLVVTKNLADKRYDSYTADLTMVKDYMFYLTSYSLASKNSCEDAVNNHLIRESDVAEYYSDSNWTPSFEWREQLVTLSSNQVRMITDSSYKLSELYLTYLRRPTKIDKEGYINFDGTPSVNVDCELPEFCIGLLTDIASKYATMFMDNPQQVKFAMERISKSE